AWARPAYEGRPLMAEDEQTALGKLMQQRYPLAKAKAILAAYQARFGDNIPWNTYLLPTWNLWLYEYSLQRGEPATQEHLKQIWIATGNPEEDFEIPPGHIQ
ncbi:MAG TPA: hypothetical protein VI542_33910, partial [Candidatus Tectomicrobia bacterium]